MKNSWQRKHGIQWLMNYRKRKMTDSLLIDKTYQWSSRKDNKQTTHYIGRKKSVDQLIDALLRNGQFDPVGIEQALAMIKGNFAAIIETEECILAVVDRIRSYPICYLDCDRKFLISNSARKIRDSQQLNRINDPAIIEICMSGYATDRDTAYADLFQLQAGEFLVWWKDRQVLERRRYYNFYSDQVSGKSENDLIDELEEATDSIFQRLIEDAAGRPIWIPLSGGLDSRLIICKLQAMGYDNLYSFSYGVPDNYEAKAARLVAERLQIPWLFVPCKIKDYRNFFWSTARSKYASFADYLCSVPNYSDLFPLQYLRDKGKIQADGVIINGQSGDFISGGHIPPLLTKPEAVRQVLLERALGKHFSLCDQLMTPANRALIEKRILQILDNNIKESGGEYSQAKQYEAWEWQERQCKFVVNGQRVYDFLGLNWELPLWQDEYLFFWRQVPVPVKFRQNLYRKYLERFDYKGLFKEFKPTIWRWPGASICFLGLAQFAKLIGGNDLKEKMYAYSKYFGHYRNQYAVYTYGHYLRHALQHRNPYSFYAATWIKENFTDEQFAHIDNFPG